MRSKIGWLTPSLKEFMTKNKETLAPKTALVLALGPAAAPRHPAAPELVALLRSLAIEVPLVARQRRLENSSPYLVGPGKLQELRDILAEWSGPPPLLVVAGEARPGPLRNLQKALGVEVADRMEIILQVFETRAETPLAQLEIERARFIHSLPRVRDQVDPGKQEGGGGRAAKGNSHVTLTKQAIKARIVELTRRIEVQRQKQDRRSARRRDVPSVALIGYTNAGKSSWMSALTGHSGGAKDQLFYTLGTRVKALSGEGSRVLVTDTVGFLEDLPHDLLEAFHSTLNEALGADLLLHIADGTSVRLHQQLEVTHQVLRHLGAANKPMLLVLNKVDLLSEGERAHLGATYPEALLQSSLSKDDARALRTQIRAHFASTGRSADAATPQTTRRSNETGSESSLATPAPVH